MRIKLSKKAKIASTIALVAAAAGVGFLLDNINRDEFIIENIPDNNENTVSSEQTKELAAPPEDNRIIDGKVNLNEADEAILEQLDGIGASTAEKIIEYRDSIGKFNTVDELINVNGIGEKKLEELRDKFCVE